MAGAIIAEAFKGKMKNWMSKVRLAITSQLLRLIINVCPKEGTDAQIILAGVLEIIHLLVDPRKKQQFEARVREHNRLSSRPITKTKKHGHG